MEETQGNFLLPYAAGIAGEVRFIYAPYNFGLVAPPPPTVLGLEPGVRYHAYFWEPSLGVRFDLGDVERSPQASSFAKRSLTAIYAHSGRIMVPSALHEASARADSCSASSTVSTRRMSWPPSMRPGQAMPALLLRFHDTDNYVAAVYSVREKALYLLERTKRRYKSPLRPHSDTGIGLSREA